MQVSSAADILRVIKEQLAEQLSRPKYELLIRPLTAIDYTTNDSDDTRLRLGISNEVLRGWLIDQYGDLLSELAQLIVGGEVAVEIEVSAAAAAQLADTTERGGETRPLEVVPPREPAVIKKPLLNPRYTFDNFVVGKANQFANSACWQVAQRPGASYNPLFLYGGVGLGKTHLMHAIGHNAWERDHNLQVAYVSSEKFTNEFIECVRTGRMPEFHQRYRGVDILLIDDIQFLSGKPETQQEFFHTFMHLLESGKQIVIAGDRPPRTLKGMEERMVTRFSMGLVCDLAEPGLETRVAILRQKALLEQAQLPEDVLSFIAERVRGNVRELEGALIRLFGIRPRLSIKQVLGVVSEYFNVSEPLLLSPNRSKRVALARMVAMYLAREYTNLTLSQIGAELGGRDHSTISHGVNKIARDILEDPYVEQAVTQISRLLK